MVAAVGLHKSVPDSCRKSLPTRRACFDRVRPRIRQRKSRRFVGRRNKIAQGDLTQIVPAVAQIATLRGSVGYRFMQTNACTRHLSTFYSSSGASAAS